ncbi:MAG TPA: nuclear transport factor 2 family protein [Chitinophagaceae bacterium]|nr:nuclear transport factor 2 family protein [Chitinophagaceae bacterium]
MKKVFFGMVVLTLLASCQNQKEEKAAPSTTGTDTTARQANPTSELLPMREGDEVKNSFAAFARGDVDAMVAPYEDNVRYVWSGGDSAIGKKAVADYYKGRWKVIDSISFPEQVVLPIRVYQSQSMYEPAGKWVLFWAMARVKYKNGKRLQFWMHTTSHYGSSGKIDFVGQYLDFYPIREATKNLMK